MNKTKKLYCSIIAVRARGLAVICYIVDRALKARGGGCGLARSNKLREEPGLASKRGPVA